jgi:hypothetical protein
MKHAELCDSSASRLLRIISYCYYNDAAKYLTDALFLAENLLYA